MVTTKTRMTFYADRGVEDHLNTIPVQLRSSWINEKLKECIEREGGKGKSLQDLHAWLSKGNARGQTEDDLFNMLNRFLKRK